MQINVKNFKEGVLRFLTTEVRIEEIGIILKLFNIEFLQTPKSVGTQVKISDLEFSLEPHFPATHQPIR